MQGTHAVSPTCRTIPISDPRASKIGSSPMKGTSGRRDLAEERASIRSERCRRRMAGGGPSMSRGARGQSPASSGAQRRVAECGVLTSASERHRRGRRRQLHAAARVPPTRPAVPLCHPLPRPRRCRRGRSVRRRKSARRRRRRLARHHLRRQRRWVAGRRRRRRPHPRAVASSSRYCQRRHGGRRQRLQSSCGEVTTPFSPSSSAVRPLGCALWPGTTTPSLNGCAGYARTHDAWLRLVPSTTQPLPPGCVGPPRPAWLRLARSASPRRRTRSQRLDRREARPARSRSD